MTLDFFMIFGNMTGSFSEESSPDTTGMEVSTMFPFCGGGFPLCGGEFPFLGGWNPFLGGGISGLSACNFLLKKNIFNTILEKENKLGGLLRPIKIKNYTFDRAVHLSFAKEKEVREVFDQTEYITHQPISYNWDKNIWIKHPVQNNLKPLNFLKKLRLIFSLLSGFFRPITKVSNYRKWLLNSYGSFFAESYPIKYTKKYWGYDPEKLSTSWLGPRMNKVKLMNCPSVKSM